MRKHYGISVIIGVNAARGADRIGSAPFGCVRHGADRVGASGSQYLYIDGSKVIDILLWNAVVGDDDIQFGGTGKC